MSPPRFITVPSSLSCEGLSDSPDLVEVHTCWGFLRPASREGAEFLPLWPQPSHGKWAAVSVQGTLMPLCAPSSSQEHCGNHSQNPFHPPCVSLAPYSQQPWGARGRAALLRGNGGTARQQVGFGLDAQTLHPYSAHPQRPWTSQAARPSMTLSPRTMGSWASMRATSSR